MTDGSIGFRSSEEVRGPIRDACAAHPDLASFCELGESEEGRPLDGIVLGRGPRTVSLIAGAHSDEPVGPETLRTFLLDELREPSALLDRWRFVVVPHINPDGEARNRAWILRWPDPAALFEHAFREPPGRDLEFGFPAMRPENRAVARFLRAHAPVALHMSLHGMPVSEGAMLLIERHWIDRSERLQRSFVAAARDAGLALHDHDRKGEKGFLYIGPGLSSTPEGAAMRAHFSALGDEETAALFHRSSMEFVRTLGGDPLCLVTELPLFVLRGEESVPGVPTAYLELRARRLRGESLTGDLPKLTPLPLAIAVELQLRALDLGLQAVQA